ncbi:TetR/AcrR family transcriptional regulator [Streptomyces sp. NBC_00249]|uniref:TetR/AcrR family transcriptional regulator n=1 Tax=Streptomyces sp. NBC_00249 TaxID=2975690 RepID=UPI00224FD3FF|nr:TetR/AcrR family transcriptional regulator [Streptomyces sp. NBC_00249]MCX5199849.1 TetR/AcrR family transcriptional regulator [Streptomyces sp. NBC_00249]
MTEDGTTRAGGARRTQAERRARTRGALLEAAARGLSRNGYANLVLAQVAAEAGYTRGALYHLFSGKEELALAVVSWVDETWTAEVRTRADGAEPVDALITLARGHAEYCRRDVAQVLMTLRVEFAGQDHPVGLAISEIVRGLVDEVAGWIEEGRTSGDIPAGPPAQVTAHAYVGVLEGIGIALAGQPPFDVELAERTVRGVLGLTPAP